jgi:hypothetical protein
MTRAEQRAANRQAGLISLAFSDTSKMPCRSWSLPALETCPGARERNLITQAMEIVDACKTCYALQGNYNFKGSKELRKFNRDEWQHPDFVTSMTAALIAEGNNYFRWFDSGDVFDIRLARKIFLIMLATPSVNHWLPTRSHKIAKFQPILEAMGRLSNVVVRYSSDSVIGEKIATDKPQSIIYGELSEVPADAKICMAYHLEESQQTANCGECRACWSKDVSAVAYSGHGAKFKKVHAAAKARKLASIDLIAVAA